MTDTMRQRFSRIAVDLLERDERVVVVLADIGDDAFEDAAGIAPGRIVNVGIMEQTLIGVAAGFALEGFHPVAHTIAPFLVERPYEQIKLDLAYQELGATLVSVGASLDYATEGATHHAPGDVQALLAIPRVEVFVPGHPDELEALLRATYANGRPSYLRTSTATNPMAFAVRPGALHVVRRGSLATVLAFGPMLAPTLDATADLDVAVVYATSLSPFDGEALASVVRDGSLVIPIEPFVQGASLPVLADALRSVAVRFAPIGVPHGFPREYGSRADLERWAGLDVDSLGRRIRAELTR